MNSKTNNLRPHRTIIVEVGPWCEKVDEELVPLIQEIWNAGIETMMSCQEVEPDIAWIEFPEINELLCFLNLITKYENGVDTLYNRINLQFVGQLSAPEWQYQFNLMDINDGEEEQVIDKKVCFDATVGVYFPTTEIPLLVQRLEAFNNSEKSLEK